MTQVDELPGEEIEFSIGDPRWVMRSMADLYSNRELAVCREYSTNAFDANKELAIKNGAVPAPIHVTMPTMMEPFFVVRDYGYGMTLDMLKNTYTKFGTSTKRDSNDFNGMLGYGSKSAVAYTEQFTVTSIANGTKTIAVVTRKPDWSIVMKIVSQVKSSDISGTEIRIPVHNPDEFRTKAMNFYKFWYPGTVLIDGKEPTQDVGEQISENFYYSTSHNSYIVMGNVPYRIENSSALFAGTGMNAISFVAYVDTGDVEFTPNRELLKYTDLTKKTLKDVITEFAGRMKQVASDEIASAKTAPEAYAAWSKWGGMLGTGLFGDLSFDGVVLKDTFDVKGYRYKYGERNGSRRVESARVEGFPHTLFITGCGTGAPPSSWKAKSQEYKYLKGLKTRQTLFVTADDFDCIWVDKTQGNVVSWEDLKKALPKAPRINNGMGGRTKDIKGSFDMYTAKGHKYEEEIPEDYKADKYFFMQPSVRKDNDYHLPSIITYMPKQYNDATVVIVGANRLAKFQRDYPDIKEFLPVAMSSLVTKTETLLSQDAKDKLSIEYYDQRALNRMDAKKIDDPEIVRYARLLKSDADTAEYERNNNLAQHLRAWGRVNKWEPKKEKVVFKKYPLMTHIPYTTTHDHVYLYLNAAYAARKDKK